MNALREARDGSTMIEAIVVERIMRDKGLDESIPYVLWVSAQSSPAALATPIARLRRPTPSFLKRFFR